MNSEEYVEVTLCFDGDREEAGGIIAAELGELPYDSFMEDTGADGRPVLKAYIGKENYDPRALKVVLSGLPFEVSFTADLVKAENWNREWEDGFEPIIIDRKVTIKSMRHKGIKRTRFNITVNPQMAFGTGHHETTYMMMETMLEHEEDIEGHIVMDMGCGTGVLGILAAKMKAEHVYGIDIDAVAARSAFGNACINRVSRHFETYYGDASLLQLSKYDVLLANIHKNIIIMDLRTYARSLRKGGLLLLSGFYDSPEDKEPIIAEAAAQGLALEGSRSRGGWCCLALRK